MYSDFTVSLAVSFRMPRLVGEAMDDWFAKLLDENDIICIDAPPLVYGVGSGVTCCGSVFPVGDDQFDVQFHIEEAILRVKDHDPLYCTRAIKHVFRAGGPIQIGTKGNFIPATVVKYEKKVDE